MIHVCKVLCNIQMVDGKELVKATKRQNGLVHHLLKFNNTSRILSEREKEEYLSYISVGGDLSKDNLLMECQRWKEWTLGQMAEEAFELWCMNKGWAVPLISNIQADGGKVVEIQTGFVLKGNCKDPIMCKAMIEMLNGIRRKGMLQYYIDHPATNKDESALLRNLKIKFGQDFEFNK